MQTARGFSFKNRNFERFSPGQKVPKTIFDCGGHGCRMISNGAVATMYGDMDDK